MDTNKTIHGTVHTHNNIAVRVWIDDDEQLQAERVDLDTFAAAGRIIDSSYGDDPGYADGRFDYPIDKAIGFEHNWLEIDIDVDGQYTTMTRKFGIWAEITGRWETYQPEQD